MAATPLSDELQLDYPHLLALMDAHRMEVLLLQTRIERMGALLREHGIPLPSEDPRLGVSDGEHLMACTKVVSAAYDLLERLEELRAIVGSGMEFVGAEPWRPRS